MAGDGGLVELILLPPGSLPALTHGATRDLLTAEGYSALYNLLGYPAGIVLYARVRAGEESEREPGADMIQRLARRVAHGSAGLPVGVQVVARPWQEHQALAAVEVIERVARESQDYPHPPIEVVRHDRAGAA